MEHIFYTALALHVAGKPVSKENIRAVLKAAGTPVNEPALEAMAAFVEALETRQNKSKTTFDPRVIKLLTSELAHHNMSAEKVEALLTELTESASPAADVDEAVVLNKTVSLEEIIGAGTKSSADIPVAVEVAPDNKGRYIYGIAAGCQAEELGQIGMAESQVYTIPYKDICAIVHDCPAEPYDSNGNELVKAWVRAHQGVLDEAKKRFGTVIPLGFDTIIRPQNGITHPDQMVKDWLREEHDRLISIMEKIEGRNEYGVQIFYDPSLINMQISAQSEEVRQIKEEMATKSPGVAYMYRQKLEKVTKSEMDKITEEWFWDFLERIKRHSDDIVVEKTKKAEKEKVMLLNLSCLVTKEKFEGLGEELEEINDTEGFSVHFSGPWPPYSFVAKPAIAV